MQSHYDPRNGRVTLIGASTPYEWFHEKAHKEQHREWCLPFRVWCHLNGIRILGYFATLIVEFDAMLRARRALRWVGSWDIETKKEAWRMLMSYAKRKEL